MDRFSLVGRQRVLVIGDPEFGDKEVDHYLLLEKKLDYYCFRFENPVIAIPAERVWSYALGKYSGANVLAERWTYSRKYLLQKFWKDKERNGTKSTVRRNKELVDHITKGKGPGYCVAFTKGNDKLTNDLLTLCYVSGVKVKEVGEW